MMPQTARAARTWRIRWAEDELQRFDRDMAAGFRSARNTLATMLAQTGCEDDPKVPLADYLDELSQHYCADKRKQLLADLDDAGGDPTRFPWPLSVEKVPA